MDVLLLTATIDPGPTPVLRLRDPKERFAHYATALRLWAFCGLFNRIVLCENSGEAGRLAALARIVRECPASLEILSFKGNSGSWSLGKGYGEGVILEHAFENSIFLRDAKAVWKSTGRLFVGNAKTLWALHEQDPNVVTPGDTRFFKVSPDFFRAHLMGLYRDVNDHRGVSIEVAYGRALAPLAAAGKVKPFDHGRDYVGQDGGSGNWHAHFDEADLAAGQRLADEAYASR